MNDFIPSIVSAAVCCALLSVGSSFLPQVKEHMSTFIKRSAVFSASVIAVFAAMGLIVPSLARVSSSPSWLSAAAATAASFGGFVLLPFVQGDDLRTFLKRLAAAAAVVFVIEAAVCNFNRFSADKVSIKPELGSMVPNDPESIKTEPSRMVFESSGSVNFSADTTENINAIKLDLKSNDTFFKVTVSMTDNNFSQNTICVGSKFISGQYGKPLWLPIKPYEKLRNVKIEITECDRPVTLSGVELTSAMPYEFSAARFLTLLLAAAAVIAIMTFRFYKVVYDCKKPLHRIAVIVLTFLCAASVLRFSVSEEIIEPIKYTADKDMTYADPYVQMFDSLSEGRVDLGVPADPVLTGLENPYDNSLRDGVPALWDRALYKGTYYSYYTIVPVILFYYPYYWIKDDLPTMNTTSVFFGIFAVVFAVGAILAFVKRFIKKPNFLLLLLIIASSPIMTGIYLGVHYSSQYSVPQVVGTCFLMLCLWAGVSAYNHLSEKKSIPLFILSGLSLALTVQSRPSKAVGALILAPLFIAVLISKRNSISRKAVSAASFLAPALIGLAFVMMYNKARFGSLLDFGQDYQLTVSDIHANTMSLSRLPGAIMHYFLQPFGINGDFPYFTTSAPVLTNAGKYTYDAFTFGVMWLPMIAIGIIGAPLLAWHNRHRKTTPYTYNDNRIRNYTYMLILVLMIFLAWAAYCKGGVIVDYLGDILPVLTLLSALIMLEIQEKLKKAPVVEYKGVCAFSLTIVVSAVLFMAVLISLHDLMLHKANLELFNELEKLICFWQ